MRIIHSIFKILTVATLLSITSCTEAFLEDIKPETSQDVYSLRYFIDDLDVLNNGAYGALFSPAGTGTFQVFTEFQSDLYYAVPAERSGWITSREGNNYAHSYSSLDYDLQAQVMQWSNLAINMVNTSIESLEKGMVDNDPKKTTDGDRVMGEAKFIRAFAHWQILSMLGKQYHASTKDTPGAIFRTKPILGLADISKGISTVGEMYELIIADLKDAQAKLPATYDATKHPVRYLTGVRKDAATALLAKVYFQMNDFDNALLQVNDLLGAVVVTGSTKYPLTTNFDNIYKLTGNQNYGPTSSKELIYGAEGSSAQKWTQDSKWTFYRFTRPKKDANNVTVTNAYGRLCIGTPLLTIFDQANDKRFLQLIEKTGSTYWQKKMALPNMNVPIFRAPEFHLMRAEILARRDQKDNAIIELNLSRKRAGLADYVWVDKNSLINEIVKERSRELFGEMVRHMDNLRLGAIDGTKVPLGQRDAADKAFVGNVDVLDWNSPFFIYTMPTNEKDYNPALQ